MSRFISEREIQEKKKAEETSSEKKLWDLVRNEPKPKPEEPRKPLWVALKENKEKKQLEEIAKMKERNFPVPRELNEDELKFLQDYLAKQEMEEKKIEKELEEFKKAQSKKNQVDPQNLTEKVDSTLLKKQDFTKDLNFKPSVKFKKPGETKKRTTDSIDDNVTSKKAKKENSLEEKPKISLVSYDFVDDDD